MEGGIGFALSAALHGAITLNKGRVEQSNFHDYQPLRINEMPNIDVHILHSTEAPTGVARMQRDIMERRTNAMRA